MIPFKAKTLHAACVWLYTHCTSVERKGSSFPLGMQYSRLECNEHPCNIKSVQMSPVWKGTPPIRCHIPALIFLDPWSSMHSGKQEKTNGDYHDNYHTGKKWYHKYTCSEVIMWWWHYREIYTATVSNSPPSVIPSCSSLAETINFVTGKLTLKSETSSVRSCWSYREAQVTL